MVATDSTRRSTAPLAISEHASTRRSWNAMACRTRSAKSSTGHGHYGLDRCRRRTSRKRCQRSCTEMDTLRLITIPISHYCEKARWALDRVGLPYREERHVQGIHQLAARRAGGGVTVPVLVTPDGPIG